MGSSVVPRSVQLSISPCDCGCMGITPRNIVFAKEVDQAVMGIALQQCYGMDHGNEVWPLRLDTGGGDHG